MTGTDHPAPAAPPSTSPPPATWPAPPPAPPPPGPRPAADPLPSEPRRHHPAGIVFGALAVGVRDVVVAVALVLSTGWWWILLVGPPVALGTAVLRWSRARWWIEGDRLVVDQGLLQRTHRELPLDRIQQVEIVRTLRHQVLGVSTLRVEAGGGDGGSEAHLLLGARDATAVRARLLLRRDRPPGSGDPRHRAPAGPPGTDEPPERVLVRLGLPRLALAGLTGPQFFALPLALVWLLSALDDLPDDLRPDLASDGVHLRGLAVVALAVVAGLTVWMAAAVVAGILTYHDLTVSTSGGDLRMRRGLLDRREVVVPATRVQSARVRHHPVLRAFGLVSLRLDSAGGQHTVDAARLIVPALTWDEALGILAVGLPEALGATPLAPAPRRALPRVLLRTSLRFAVPAALVGSLLGLGAGRTAALVGLATAAGLTRGVLIWRGLGAHLSPELVVSRRGAVVRTVTYVPTRKAQSARSHASWFQRRRRLVDAAVDVAGQRRAPTLAERDEGEADRLHAIITPAAGRDEARIRTERVTADDGGDGVGSGGPDLA